MKKRSTLLGCFLLLFISFQSFAQVTRWDFTTDLGGWVPYGFSSTVSGGYANLTITGTSTQFTYNYPTGTTLNPALYNYVHIRLKNNTSDTRGKFFWFRNDSPQTYSYVYFNINPYDTTYTDYIIEMSNIPAWTTANIKTLRFDVPDADNESGTVGIDYISIDNTTPPYAPATWTHPGISNTLAELEEVKSRIAGNIEPQKSGWLSFLPGNTPGNTCTHLTDSTYVDHARDSVKVDSVDATAGGFTCDGTAMYSLALRWYMTGDANYAKAAIRIMNDWSSQLTTIYTQPGYYPTQNKLIAALVTSNYAEAAELIVHTYPNWAADGFDFTAYKSMLNTVFYPLFKYGAPDNGNWEASMIQAMLAISIVVEDKDMFNRAICMAKDEGNFGTGRGSIVKYICPITGQCQETCRDVRHTQMGIGLLVRAAETAHNQGVDLYGAFPGTDTIPRLAKGLIYLAQLLRGVSKNTNDGCASDFIGTGNLSPCGTLNWSADEAAEIWEFANNHYNYRESKNYTDIQWVVTNKSRVEGIRTYGSYGYGTLTHGDLGNIDTTMSLAMESYTAKLENKNRVKLQWTVIPDTQSDHFEITRSTDGKNFSLLTKVSSLSNNNPTGKFTIYDNNAAPATNVYRLVQVNKDNKTKNYGLRTVEVKGTGPTILVFPNPASTEVNVTYHATTANNFTIQLVDVTSGKTVFDHNYEAGNDHISISLSGLRGGAYLVYLKDGTFIGRQKLIVK